MSFLRCSIIYTVTRMSCREYNLNKKQHAIELVFEGFELFTYSSRLLHKYRSRLTAKNQTATNPTLLACNQPCLPVSRRVRATALDAGRVLIGNKIMMTILKIFKLGGVSLVLCGMMEVTAMEG
jgi:hypothetical protein